LREGREKKPEDKSTLAPILFQQWIAETL